MPVFAEYAPGTFCWIDTGSTDHEASKAFYAGLFGWEAEDRPTPGGGIYTMFRKDGHVVAGAYPLAPEMRALGVDSHWMSYVSVTDAGEALGEIAAANGTVMGPPIPIPDTGVMGVFSDPTGAACAVWQAGGHAGAALANEPGSLIWNELLTDDVDRAGEFYSRVFGWDIETQVMPAGPYHVFKDGEDARAGMLAITPDMGDFPPAWTAYLAVGDIEGAAGRVAALGGRIEGGIMDVPGAGRMAITADPAGAVFMMMESA